MKKILLLMLFLISLYSFSQTMKEKYMALHNPKVEGDSEFNFEPSATNDGVAFTGNIHWELSSSLGLAIGGKFTANITGSFVMIGGKSYSKEEVGSDFDKVKPFTKGMDSWNQKATLTYSIYSNNTLVCTIPVTSLNYMDDNLYDLKKYIAIDQIYGLFVNGCKIDISLGSTHVDFDGISDAKYALKKNEALTKPAAKNKLSQEDKDFWNGGGTKKQPEQVTLSGNKSTNKSKDLNVNNRQALPSASGSYIVNGVVRTNTNNTNQNTKTKLSKAEVDYWNGGGAKKQTQQNNNSGSTTNSYAMQQQTITASNSLVEEGNSLQKSGDYEGAQAKYKEALKLNPNNALAVQNNGIAIQNSVNKSKVDNHNKAVVDAVLLNQAATQLKMQAAEKLAGIAFTVFSNISEDKAKKRQEEEEARQAQIAREERAEKKRQLVADRKNLVTNFNQAKMPLSAQTHNIDEVYFFMYKCDETALESNAPYIYVSNIFSIDKYADGTWPFINTVADKIAKATKESKYKLVGYFSNRTDADAKLQEFINNCSTYGFTIKDVTYNTPQTATKANTSNADFWGNPVNDKTADKDKENNNKSATDFWGNPIKN